VVLKSAYGESAPLRLKESKGIKKGTLFGAFHFEERFINRLFGDESDSVTKTLRFSGDNLIVWVLESQKKKIKLFVWLLL